MRPRRLPAPLGIGLVTASCLIAWSPPAAAQQITGTPGAPSATTTVDGRYLPNPPAPFGGVINLDAKQIPSPGGRRPWCRPRAHPTCC